MAYSLSEATFVFWSELDSSSFLLVRWVDRWMGEWVELRLKLTQPPIGVGAELGKNQLYTTPSDFNVKLQISTQKIKPKFQYPTASSSRFFK